MARKTIVLRGDLDEGHFEFPAAAALSPGHALKRNSSNQVLKVATEGDTWNRMIAKEDGLRGKTVADAYAATDQVPVHQGEPGDVVQMLFKAGVAYAVGDLLITDTSGRLIKASAKATATTIKQYVGEVDEALSLSATGAVDTLGSVRLF